MIVVTGGAGFIGSNLVHELNETGQSDILVVDNLTAAEKFRNLVRARITDYQDKEDFAKALRGSSAWLDQIEMVLHQGACSSTTETDGRYMLRNNYEYSKELLEFCLERKIPFIYASSAAVYGAGSPFREEPGTENPLNVYGYSKALFDSLVLRLLPGAASQVVGLRYFNVYGPREAHKGAMASIVLQLDDQLSRGDKVRLFGPTRGYEAGEQRRDFIFVKDVVRVALWFWSNPDKSGIFNCGTGSSRTFNEVASQVIRTRGHGEIEYIPFPDSLRGHYQSYTEADLTQLRECGYSPEFVPLEEGIREYLLWRTDSGEA